MEGRGARNGVGMGGTQEEDLDIKQAEYRRSHVYTYSLITKSPKTMFFEICKKSERD
jgi:hypothetical protein